MNDFDGKWSLGTCPECGKGDYEEGEQAVVFLDVNTKLCEVCFEEVSAFCAKMKKEHEGEKK